MKLRSKRCKAVRSRCYNSADFPRMQDELHKDGLLRTRGLDADQTEAAIKATFKMLNIIESDLTK